MCVCALTVKAEASALSTRRVSVSVSPSFRALPDVFCCSRAVIRGASKSASAVCSPFSPNICRREALPERVPVICGFCSKSAAKSEGSIRMPSAFTVRAVLSAVSSVRQNPVRADAPPAKQAFFSCWLAAETVKGAALVSAQTPNGVLTERLCAAPLQRAASVFQLPVKRPSSASPCVFSRAENRSVCFSGVPARTSRASGTA